MSMRAASLGDRVRQTIWDAGRLAVSPFIHSGLSTEEGYRPKRHAVLRPDETLLAETSAGEVPVHVYNVDALGDRSDATDIYQHMSLAVRPDQGFVSATTDRLQEIAREHGRALVVIGAPGTGGRCQRPSQFARYNLHRTVEVAHDAIDRLAEAQHVDLTRGIHTGASLGGYIALTFADRRVADDRAAAGKPDHAVAMSIPVAPAGWSLRPNQIPLTFYQFLVLEEAHVVDKASLMEPDEREEYLRSLRETVPRAAAVPGIVRLALDFLLDGDLEKRIRHVPADTPIRAVAFDGDHVTLPRVLEKHLTSGRFHDIEFTEMDGRHMSLASNRKVMRTVIEPALAEELAG